MGRMSNFHDGGRLFGSDLTCQHQIVKWYSDCELCSRGKLSQVVGSDSVTLCTNCAAGTYRQRGNSNPVLPRCRGRVGADNLRKTAIGVNLEHLLQHWELLMHPLARSASPQPHVALDVLDLPLLLTGAPKVTGIESTSGWGPL